MVKTDADNIFFMSSSGHCNLDCEYCIVNPIAKHLPSLDIKDIDYILNFVSGKSALLFSGKGDFFAGYKKGDNLLSNILDRNVDVGLDINGVVIHEFPLLTDAQVSKIKHINLTMHYTQIKRKNAIKVWENNAKLIISRWDWPEICVNMVMSPLDSDIWDEALNFYDQRIFQETGQAIVLIKDVLSWDESFEDKLIALKDRFSHMVTETRTVDFVSMFEGHKQVLCPAGKEYFRVWNDGAIEGCPIVEDLANLGNAKKRTFVPRTTLFSCNQPGHCDCHHILAQGKMRFPQEHGESSGSLS